MTFDDLGLAEPLLRAIHAENYTQPTPIQAQAIPYLLEGRDLLGIAQTGTGKTAAFALPILQRLSANPVPRKRGAVRALILTPTRELAVQIVENFRSYGRNLGLRSAVIFGGVGQQPQVDNLARGLDVLVATPGRLLDLMNQRHADLRDLSILVLDEADRMLDMGFIHDVKRIIATLPKERQTLFFSATMPNDVEKLANNILKEPVRVEVTPPATTVERIDQRVYFVDAGNKNALLADLLKDQAIERVLVFTRTKHGADRVVKHIERTGVEAQAIHGNKSQNARQRALNDFRDGNTRVLVATDIAARGIDVDGITHVINFEIPNVPETYVHRIGRTARAGRDGVALTFCDKSEKGLLRDVERLTRKPLTVVHEHHFHGPAARPAQDEQQERERDRSDQRGRGRGHRGAKPLHQRARQPSRDENAREQHNRDQPPRDRQERSQAPRDPQGRDQRGRDFRERDYRDGDQQSGGRQERNNASRAQQGRDQEPRNRQERDHAPRDQHGRDQQPRDRQGRDRDQQAAPQQQRQRSAPQPHAGHKPGDRPMRRPDAGPQQADGARPLRHQRPHGQRRRRPQQAQA
ncbi:MAG TPA: DEAD/DEAH box helicase [Stellaceae bacterium]|jgi:ATP-dependent RNA helicase RhlE|nr:DEAD/DEAH box helicase [Stellaceae bacterium]